MKQETFASPSVEAIFNLLIASDYLRQKLDATCAPYGITRGQYNVLRILRGAHPAGYPRCEIISRMLENAPDVTRLLDRLEARSFVERDRSEKDKRLSIARIAANGMTLLDRMEPDLRSVERHFAELVSRRDCRELSRICEGIYGEEM